MALVMKKADHNSYSGFGDYVMVVKDDVMDSTVCVIGYVGGEERVHFPTPVPIRILQQVIDLINHRSSARPPLIFPA